MLRRSILKIERWRLGLWKHQIQAAQKRDITDPDDPAEPFLREYSNGVNAGLQMALDWFERYVEGKK